MRGPDNPAYGKKPWNKGIPRTPEEKRNISAAIKKHNLQVLIDNGWDKLPRTGCPMKEEQKRRESEMFSGEGNPFYGKHHTDATKELLKQLKADTARPIDMLDLKTGDVIKHFESLHDAARYINELRGSNNADKSFISRCAEGRYKWAYGFGWRFSGKCND